MVEYAGIVLGHANQGDMESNLFLLSNPSLKPLSRLRYIFAGDNTMRRTDMETIVTNEKKEYIAPVLKVEGTLEKLTASLTPKGGDSFSGAGTDKSA